jgi:hypothetical protein
MLIVRIGDQFFLDCLAKGGAREPRHGTIGLRPHAASRGLPLNGIRLEVSMAKPNYAFAKRQRELAKKQKKEAKKQRSAPAAPESAEQAPAAVPPIPSPDQ